MPCLFAILALFVPRVVIVVLWFASDWLQTAYDGLLWPLLGFFFAPTSLLWYSVVVNYYGGAWTTVSLVGMVLAVLIDVSQLKSKG